MNPTKIIEILEKQIDRLTEDNKALRLQNEKITEKFLAFSGEASQNYASLRAAAEDKPETGPHYDNAESIAAEEERLEEHQISKEERAAVEQSKKNLRKLDGRPELVHERLATVPDI